MFVGLFVILPLLASAEGTIGETFAVLRHASADPCNVVVAGYVAFVATREGDQDDPTRMAIQEWLWGDGPKRVRLEGRTSEPGPQLYCARPTDQPDVYHATAAFNTDRLDHDRRWFAEFKTVRSVFRGRIVVQDGGRKIPLAGAIVRARSDRQFAQTITVGDGSFEFLGLPQSWYVVSGATRRHARRAGGNSSARAGLYRGRDADGTLWLR